jgi:hypothetical protein
LTARGRCAYSWRDSISACERFQRIAVTMEDPGEYRPGLFRIL